MQSNYKVRTDLLLKRMLIILLFFPSILYSQIDFSQQNSFDIITWNLEWFPKQGSITVDSVKEIIEVIFKGLKITE